MIQNYFEIEEKYENKYGKKTVVLYKCGGFFEIYGDLDSFWMFYKNV